MPLNLPQLTSDLETLFAAPAATHALAAQAWANAVKQYAIGVVPPSPAVSGAADALVAPLTAAFATPAAAPGMDAAFAQFGASVAASMPGFVGAPPTAPVGFAALFAPPFPATHAAAASKIAGRIDSWMRTGTSVPSGGGPTTRWV